MLLNTADVVSGCNVVLGCHSIDTNAGSTVADDDYVQHLCRAQSRPRHFGLRVAAEAIPTCMVHIIVAAVTMSKVNLYHGRGGRTSVLDEAEYWTLKSLFFCG